MVTFCGCFAVSKQLHTIEAGVLRVPDANGLPRSARLCERSTKCKSENFQNAKHLLRARLIRSCNMRVILFCC